MKKKILYIDYLNPKGHIKFNKVQLLAISELDVEVDVICDKDYFDLLNIEMINHIDIFSNKKSSDENLRVYYIKYLLKIKKYLANMSYYKIIFASYEIVSFSLIFRNLDCIVINHNNIGEMDNVFKQVFYRILNKKNIKHVSLHKNFSKILEDRLNVPCSNIPHGFLFSSRYNECEIDDFPILKSKNFIFMPSNRNIDIILLEKICNSKRFNDFLAVNNLYFVFKLHSKIPLSNSNNIIQISGYLENYTYEWLIQNAFSVLFLYSSDFKNRVSGIMFECISCNTPFYYLENKAMDVSIDYCKYEACFRDIDDLLIKLNSLITNSTSENDFFNLTNLDSVKSWEILLK